MQGIELCEKEHCACKSPYRGDTCVCGTTGCSCNPRRPVKTYERYHCICCGYVTIRLSPAKTAVEQLWRDAKVCGYCMLNRCDDERGFCASHCKNYKEVYNLPSIKEV